LQLHLDPPEPLQLHLDPPEPLQLHLDPPQLHDGEKYTFRRTPHIIATHPHINKILKSHLNFIVY